jgi:hypothetical protein
LKAGSLTASVFSPGAASRRFVNSGLCWCAKLPSLVSVGLSSARKSSRRSKSVDRSARRWAEIAAVSRAS